MTKPEDGYVPTGKALYIGGPWDGRYEETALTSQQMAKNTTYWRKKLVVRGLAFNLYLDGSESTHEELAVARLFEAYHQQHGGE